MSFIGIVKEDLKEAEQVALSAAKTTLNYIDNVFVQDIEPILIQQLMAAIEKLGQEAVAALLGSALGNAAPPVIPTAAP